MYGFSVPFGEFLAKSLKITHLNLLLITEKAFQHSKSERSVLALKTGPFRWVKYSPIFGSNLASLNQGQYSPIS